MMADEVGGLMKSQQSRRHAMTANSTTAENHPEYNLMQLKSHSTKFTTKLEAEIVNNKTQLNHMIAALSGTSTLNKSEPLLRLYLFLKRNCSYLLDHAHKHDSMPMGSAMDNKLNELVATYTYLQNKDAQMECILQLATLFDQSVFHLCSNHLASAGMVSLSGRSDLEQLQFTHSEEEEANSNDGGASKGIQELVQLAKTFKGFEKIVRVVAEETAGPASTNAGEAVMNSYARREISLLRQQLDNKDAAIADLQNQIEESSERATSTQQTFNQLRSQISKFRTKCNNYELEISRLKATNDKLQASQDSSNDVIAQLRSQVNVIQSAYNRDVLEMKPHYERSLRTLQGYLTEIESMRYSLDFGTKRTCFLEKKILEQEGSIDELQSYIRLTPDREVSE